MRYWVYINDKVQGPYAEDNLVTLEGFTPDTLICSEDTANSGNQEWVKASSVFEFEQEEIAPQPAESVASTGNAVATGDLSLLLAKLDVMTSQLTGLQSKLDGMQTKLDESISTQQKASEEAAARAEALAAQVNNITAAPRTIENDSQEQASNSVDAPTDVFKSINTIPAGQLNLGEFTSEESADDNILDKEGDAFVLNSALNSLHNNKNQAPAPQPKQGKEEDTFQDLLTPAQAARLAQEPEATPDNSSTADKQKEEVLAEFTKPNAGENDVLDQVIKEKEEDEAKKSMTMRWLSAGAAALAGAVGLKSKKGNEHPQEQPDVTTDKTPEPQPTEELTPLSQEESQPVASTDELPQEKPTLEFAEEPSPEQPAPLTVSEQPIAPNAQATPEESQSLPTSQTEEPATQEPVAENQPQETQAPQSQVDLPSIDDNSQKQESPEIAEGKESQAPQELVPGATNDSDNIITEDDLKDAFTERKPQEEVAVEQLFGLANANAAVNATPSANSAEKDNSAKDTNLPSLEDAVMQKMADAEKTTTNPNDLTEIELKEGSTYLISDFVPPALSSENEEKSSENHPTDSSDTKKAKDNDIELQEMVTSAKVEETKTEPAPANPAAEIEATSTDVTISQIVLENTIKAKRGAALDIKTVPMVPEPAQTDRLHIEGMDDDINTQHDLKAADVKPAGKTAKIIVGSILALLLLAAIYAMLGFMSILPAQFNIFAKQQAAQTAQKQEAQLDEMLGTDGADMPVQVVDENAPMGQSVSAATILEEVKNFMLPNGKTLQSFIEAKHPTAVDAITWDISTAVDPDNYSILVKVPPENPQSFKTSYRFNYNAVTKALDPTISDAKNLLDSAKPAVVWVEEKDMKDFQAIGDSLAGLSHLSSCLQNYEGNISKGYNTCVCGQKDQKAISTVQGLNRILANHPQWTPTATLNAVQKNGGTRALNLAAITSILQATQSCVK